MADVLFGDVEDSVIIALQVALTERVYDRVPKVTNEMLPIVTVTRLGGPRVNVAAEQATVTVESWAKDWRTAHDLCQRARTAIHALPGQVIAGNSFSKVTEFSGPGRLVDPVSGYPRFVFTVSITVRPHA